MLRFEYVNELESRALFFYIVSVSEESVCLAVECSLRVLSAISLELYSEESFVQRVVGNDIVKRVHSSGHVYRLLV